MSALPNMKPFLGVPSASVRVENPDGVFLGDCYSHNLYDRTPPLAQPLIPGDYQDTREVTNPKT